jgi:DNA-binding response OmpR family regulator
MKILIIEDEPDLSSAIKEYLTTQANICEAALNFETAYQKISLYNYDCILLDLMLPDGDGLKLLEHLRSLNKTEGVIIISARNALDDRIAGLNLGADDYLTKPFHLSELNARIAAVARRKNHLHSNILTFKELTVDLDAKTLKVNGRELHLTRKEYDLLLFFMHNKGKAISKNAAAEHLWGDDADMADSFDFIYTHIKNVRKKLADAGANDYFHSVYGVGYRFADL